MAGDVILAVVVGLVFATGFLCLGGGLGGSTVAVGVGAGAGAGAGTEMTGCGRLAGALSGLGAGVSSMGGARGGCTCGWWVLWIHPANIKGSSHAMLFAGNLIQQCLSRLRPPPAEDADDPNPWRPAVYAA